MQPQNELSIRSAYPVRAALTFAVCVIGALVVGGIVLLFSTPQQLPGPFGPVSVPPVLTTVLFALAVPPVPWVLAWLLGQTWRYMFPIDEQGSAMRLGWRVSAAVTALMVLALAFWLLDTGVDFSAICGIVMTIIVVACVMVAVRTARQRQFTDTFVWRIGIGTALLALIVPLDVFTTLRFNVESGGNSSLFALFGLSAWPLTLLLILGFIVYRRALAHYLDQLHSHVTLWQLDRLALEILVLFLLMFVPLSVVTGIIVHVVGSIDLLSSCLNGLLVIFGVPFLGALALTVYTRWRGRGIVIKKKASPLELHDTPLFADNRWFRMLFTRTLLWLGGTFMIWVLFFLAEGAIGLWKSRLLY